MIEFPETALAEWERAASVAEAGDKLAAKISHEVEVEASVRRLRVRHEAAELHQQELDADSTPPLEMGTLTDYLNNPTATPTDLIEGVMNDNSLVLVLGPSGAGKSSLGLQMIHSLMTGSDFLTQKVTQITGAIGVLSYDMDASMIYDWIAGAPGINPDDLVVVNAHRRGNPLGVPTHRAAMVKAMQAKNTEVILVDSFSASFFGNDQNDIAATVNHYRDLKLFQTEVGARVLIVIVHSTPDKPLKPRGASAHNDEADSIIAITADEQNTRTVQMVKYREARGQHMMASVCVTAPDAVTHLVDVDYGTMSIKGMSIPASAGAKAFFADVPDKNEESDVSMEYDQGVADRFESYGEEDQQ